MENNEQNKLERKENFLKNPKFQEMIDKKVKEIKDYIPRVGIFGVTGVGKSSLCNVLFGHDVTPISHVSACTREAIEIELKNSSGDAGIILIDVPGVGETVEKDVDYFKLYKELSPTLDLVLWVIKADDRAYAVAQKAYDEILKKNLSKCPVLFIINQVDKIEPIFDEKHQICWNIENNEPNNEKQVNIDKKVFEVSKEFKVLPENIVTVSTVMKYGLEDTMNKIIDVLPNEKKFSMYREAAEELKNEYLERKVEKDTENAIWSWIKEKASDLGEYIADNKEVITEFITTTASSLFSKWFKKR